MDTYFTIAGVSKRVFVIGDIHGCSAELKVLLDFLQRDLALTQEDLVVFIGDYIDRGPDSKGVIEILLELQLKFPSTVFLRGNHEDMLLGFLGMSKSKAPYLQNGGDSFFLSYGIVDLISLEQILDIIPKSHLDFVTTTQRYAISENFIFAHAGLDPLRPPEYQIDEDIYWIREVFINNVHRFGKPVIFGHTPYKDVHFNLPYKIGIDTGLVFGNKLSCLELVESKILQVKHATKNVQVSCFPSRERLGKRLV